MSNMECINGWMEILQFKFGGSQIHTAVPPITNSFNLKNFKEEHYEMVGSPIPLCEYYSAFELYRQFVVAVDKEFNIPRPLATFDAINICMNDAKLGRRVTTLMLWNKSDFHQVVYREQRTQYHPDFKHCLLIRKNPFRSMAPRVASNE